MAIAGVFPGQGSQSVGMLKELSEVYPQVKETFQDASDILGRDLWSIRSEGSKESLNDTENTQPAMLAAGIAVWRIWQANNACIPVAMAGHSLGEYSALVATEALSFTDAVSLVEQRAKAMKQAVKAGEGAMAAILGLADEDVIAVCGKATEDQVVEAVNFNAPGQVVIAGHAEAVDRAIPLAKEAGAKRAIKLAVSVPSHCRLMIPAAEVLQAKLAPTHFAARTVPVVHNVDVAVHENTEAIRQALQQQLYQPVRWVESVQHLRDAFNVQTLLEFGPGKVLMGLNRRIDRKMKAICIHDPASLDKALAACA